VNCPVCQADGTELGNQIIARALALSTPPAPMAISSSGAIKIGIPQAAVPATPTARSGFVAPSVPRSSKDLQPAAVPASAISTTSAAPAAIPVAPVMQVVPAAKPLAPTPVGGTKLSVSSAHAVSTQATDSPPEPRATAQAQVKKIEADISLTRGLVGIGAASFLGLLLWFAITLFLGAKFKWIAIGIGWMIGWAGYKLAKEKSQRLGLAAATATALVMIVGVLWSARQEAYQAVNETIDELWKEEVTFAKRAVEASATDAQLRIFLAQDEIGGDDDSEESTIIRVGATTTELIDDEALVKFKKDELPRYRKVAEGKVSKSQFERENRPILEQVFTLGYILEQALKVKVLILVGLAVGAAWKLSSGA
jgi:hypothetical protein